MTLTIEGICNKCSYEDEIKTLQSENDRLREEIDMKERSLMNFCNLVNAHQAQGGGREFARQIGFAFQSIREAGNMPEFVMHPEAKEALNEQGDD